jgi:hypothetical protein
MLCILPSKSYVRNVGFVEGATHTDEIPEWMDNGTEPVRFPIKYREKVEWDKEFDIKYMTFATKQAPIVKVKNILGLDVNKSVFVQFKRKK